MEWKKDVAPLEGVAREAWLMMVGGERGICIAFDVLAVTFIVTKRDAIRDGLDLVVTVGPHDVPETIVARAVAGGGQ